MVAQPATISAYVKKLTKTSLVGLGGVNPPKVWPPTNDKGGATRGAARRATVRDDMGG